ncbi:hypothetical protein [Marinibactrum halimedae]|uniref:hypothetical protein n=1 Tax=Marinibactrum halimedae TaxID=1444977 RepID=UPI0024E0F13B|nr:hypothetical protein [Marinibactrum halimedae]
MAGIDISGTVSVTEAGEANTTGTTQALTLNTSGDLTAASIGSFTGVTGVTGDADNTIDISDSDVTLSTTGFRLDTTTIDVDGITTVTNAGDITGTALADAFSVTGTNTVSAQANGAAAAIAFSGVTAVDGSGSADSDSIASSGSTTLVAANSVSDSGITFTNVESVTGATTLTGTTAADALEVTANNSLSVFGMSIGNVSNYDTGMTGVDTIDINSNGIALTASGFTVANINITGDVSVSEVGDVDTTGTTESLTLTTAGVLTATSIGTFTGVTGVNGDSANTIDISDSDVTLSATGFRLDGTMIDVDGITTVTNAGDITATALADAFSVTGTNTVSAQANGAAEAISFSGVTAVNGNGVDDGDSVASSGTVTLGGTDSVIDSGITFSSVDTVTNAGAVTGSTLDEAYVITGNNSLSVSGMTLSNVNSVDANGNAGNTDQDSVALISSVDVLSSESISSSLITFTNIESASNAGTLTGTTGDDTFQITGTNEVTFLDITFSDVTSINAGTGSETEGDTVVNTTGNSVTVTASETLSSNSISFSDVELVTASGGTAYEVFGTTGDDVFDVTNEQAFTLQNIAFSDVGSARGRSGTDTVTNNNADSATSSVELSSSNQQFTTASISFINIEEVTNAGAVVGTTGDDSFVVTAAGGVTTSNSIALTGVTSIDGGAETTPGVDDITLLIGAGLTLNNATTGEFVSSGITISDIETVSNAGDIVGTASDEAFRNLGSGQIELLALVTDTNAIVTFNGVSSIDGDGGNNALDNNFRSITMNDPDSGFVENDSNVTFTNVFSTIDTGNVTASSNANDTVTLNSVTGMQASLSMTASPGTGTNTYSMEGVTSFDAGDQSGSDPFSDTLINNSGLDISGNSFGGVTFTNFEVFSLSSNLIGTTGADLFIVEGANTVTFNDAQFINVLTISGDDGTDTIQLADGATLDDVAIVVDSTSGLTGVSTNGFVATEIEAVSVNVTDPMADQFMTVTGLSTDESYSITAANTLALLNTDATTAISFSGVDIFNAGTGTTDSLDVTNSGIALADSATRSSATNPFDFTVQGIDVFQIDNVVNTGALTATNDNEVFNITGTESLSFSSFTFSGVTSLDAGGGTNSIDNQSGQSVNIQSVNTFSLANIDVSSVTSVTNVGALVGSSGDDAFTDSADGNITAGSILYQAVTSVDGNGEVNGDSVSLGNQNVTLNAAGFDAGSSSISYEGIENVSHIGSLTGQATTASDYALTGASAVSVNGIGFTGTTSIAAGSNVNDSLSAFDGVTLTASGFTASSIDVTGVETVTNTGLFTGSSAADTMVLSGTSLAVSGIDFQGVSQIDGAGGSDSIGINSAGLSLAVTDASFDVNAGGVVDIMQVESVSDIGTLSGSAGNDAFVLNGSAVSVTGLSINLSDVTAIDGNGGASDTVDINNQDVTLATDGSATSTSINLSDLDFYTNVGQLSGSTAAEVFSVTGANEVAVSSIVFQGVNTVDAGAGSVTDTVDNDFGGSVDLIASESASVGGITFTEVEAFSQTGTLVGTDGDDSFVEDGGTGNAISVFDISFNGVTQIDGGGHVNGDSLANGDYGVNLTDSGFTSNSGIEYVGIESVTRTGAIVGTANGETYSVTGDNSVNVGSFGFEDVTSVDGGAGSDTFVSLSGAVLSSAADIDFVSSNMDIANIETVTAVGDLTGTAGADEFTLDGNGVVTANTVRFENVTSVDGSDGSDVFDANSNGVTLSTDANIDFTSQNVAVSNIETVTETNSLTGSSNAEAFTVTGAGLVSESGISFQNVASLDGGEGNDALVAGNAGVTLSSASGVDFNVQSVAVTSVESVSQVNTLTGTDADESFDVVATNSVVVNALTFEDVNTLSGGGGSDTVINTINDVVSVVSDSVTTLGNIAFDTIETVSLASTLLGSNTGEVFEDQSGNAFVVNGVTYEDVATIDGSGGDDTFVLAGSDVALTGNSGSDTVQSSGDWIIASLDGTGANGSVSNATFTGIDSLAGDNDTTTSLLGPDQDINWTVNGQNSGQLATVNNDLLTFTGITNLTGGSGTDVFSSTSSANIGDLSGGTGNDTFLMTAGSVGNLSGGAGDDVFTVDGASTGSISGDAGNDRLISGDDANTWTVTGSNTGTLNSTLFTAVENLTSGTGNDTFELSSGSITSIQSGAGDDIFTVTGATVTERLDGETGSNTLSAVGDWLLSSLSEEGSAAGVAGGVAFENIQTFIGDGGASTALTGPSEALIWQVFDTGSGTLSRVGGSGSASFSGFNVLNGRGGNNTFAYDGEPSTWTLTQNLSTVSQYQFTGMESLIDNTGEVAIDTSLAINFTGANTMNVGSLNFNYNGSPLTINGASSVSGNIVTSSDLILAGIQGDINLTGDLASIDATTVNTGSTINIGGENGLASDVYIRNLETQNGNISVQADGDIIVNVIDTNGTGNTEVLVQSNSGSVLAVGSADGVFNLVEPTASGEIRDANIFGDLVTLNALSGSVNDPSAVLVIDGSEDVFIGSLSFTEPTFLQEPDNFETVGEQLESIAEVASSSGVRAATQNGLDQAGSIDPAIFTNLLPFAAGDESIAMPDDQKESGGDEFFDDEFEEFDDYEEEPEEEPVAANEFTGR